ncbi:MAG: GntR family transcriptional regulator [Propionicimonas sp.]
MLFRIDFAGAEPLFRQLADQIRTAAASGELRAGERLPAARELADSLDISLHTVLHAYQELRDEGLLELRRGRGAVLTGAATQDLSQLRRALATAAGEAKRRGLSLDTTIGLLKEAFR